LSRQLEIFGLSQQGGCDPRALPRPLQAGNKFPSGASVALLAPRQPAGEQIQGIEARVFGLPRLDFCWPGFHPGWKNLSPDLRIVPALASNRNRSEEPAKGEGPGSIVPAPLRVAP
jgi:hypothetical protein